MAVSLEKHAISQCFQSLQRLPGSFLIFKITFRNKITRMYFGKTLFLKSPDFKYKKQHEYFLRIPLQSLTSVNLSNFEGGCSS